MEANVVELMTEREILLKKISTYQFAALDLQLFLDTHPNDTETVTKMRAFKEKAQPLIAEYESKLEKIKKRQVNIKANTDLSPRALQLKTTGIGLRLRGRGKARRSTDVCI